MEKWLIECELAMRNSLEAIVQESNKAYAASDRIDWILSWPGQVVLCVSKLFWTLEVEESIANCSIKAYVEKLNNQLTAIVNKVFSVFG